ncbi:ribonuclease H-like domain-containing protein [Mycena galericulata]|nr:ribonuclease H-like domain-containing protein [Mycena galericulata]
MPSPDREYFYGVHRGRVTGVFRTWEEAKWAIGGYRYPRQRKFLTMEDAQEYVATGIVPQHATHTEMVAGKKRPASADVAGPISRSGDVKNEPIDLTIDDVVNPEDMDVVYVHGYGWSKDEGNGTATPIAGVAVWWGSRDRRNLAERCPDDQSNNCASLFSILRALETCPPSVRPLQIISGSKYATDCINSWLTRWLKNGFKTRNNEPIKHEALLRCIGAHLDERRHAGKDVRLVYVPAAAHDASSQSARSLAKRAAQGAPVPPRDYTQITAMVCARMTGAPRPIGHALESHVPTPRTPPQKKQRVEAPAPAPPVHAALLSAMYSPRKMAILAQAAAILAIPPVPHPTFAALPAVLASLPPLALTAPPPPPPGHAAPPVVRSKVPRPGRPKTSHAPPPPPIRPALMSLPMQTLDYGQRLCDPDLSPYESLLAEHGVSSELP